MAISVVQSVTGRVENTTQIQLQLTGVTPGNALAVLWSIYQVWDPVPLGVSDDKSGSYVEAAGHSRTLDTNLYIASGVHIATAVTGGTTTVTLTLWAGTYVTATLVELAGVDSADPIDLSAGSDGNSSGPASGTTGTSTADGMALAVLSVMPDDDGDANVGIDLPAGYTNLGIEQDASDNLGHSADGKVISSAAAQSASWGTLDVGAREWSGAIATLNAASGGGGPTGISHVGGTTSGFAGTTSTGNISLSGLELQEGDVVVVAYGVGTAARNPTLTITGNNSGSYTEVTGSPLLSDDNYDTKLSVFLQVMGATPDTQITRSGTGNAADGGAVVVKAFRGVDPTTPLDVAPTTATGINTSRADPASITPVTDGAWVVAIGAGAYSNMGTAYTSSDLTAFDQNTGADTNDVRTAMGYIGPWSSGAVNPAAFGGGSTNSQASWAALTLALRPAPTSTNWNAIANLGGVGTLAAAGRGIFAAQGALGGAGNLGAVANTKQAAHATLSGAGTLAGLGQNQLLGRGTLSGVGTLAATANRSVGTSALLAAVGTLAASGRRQSLAWGNLAAVGTLAATGVRVSLGQAALAAVGSLTAAASRTSLASGTLGGVGTLAALGQNQKLSWGTLTGAGFVMADGTVSQAGQTYQVTATLGGIGTIAASPQNQVLAWGALAGVGTVVVSPAALLRLAATFNGVGTLAAVAQNRKLAAGTLAAIGTIAASPAARLRLAGVLSGTAMVSAQAVRTSLGDATLSGAGTLAAEPSARLRLAAIMAGVGTIEVRSVGGQFAEITLGGVGSLAAGSQALLRLAATLDGAGTVTVAGRGVYAAHGVLAGIGSLFALGRQTHAMSAALGGVGSLAATNQLAALAAATLSGAGGLTADAWALIRTAAALTGEGTLFAQLAGVQYGAATLNGMASLSANATALLRLSIAFNGVGTVSAQALARRLAAATLAGEGVLSASGRVAFGTEAILAGAGGLTAGGPRIAVGMEALLGGDADVVAEAYRTAFAEAILGGEGHLELVLNLRFARILLRELEKRRILARHASLPVVLHALRSPAIAVTERVVNTPAAEDQAARHIVIREI